MGTPTIGVKFISYCRRQLLKIGLVQQKGFRYDTAVCMNQLQNSTKLLKGIKIKGVLRTSRQLQNITFCCENYLPWCDKRLPIN